MTPEEGEDSGWEKMDEAIESDEEREDGNKSGGPARFVEEEMFQRVTSKPNLISRRSLLTTLIHENDRALALQNAASRSAPAIHRLRAPNGPISLDSTRINMISKELNGSLRKDLLWERQIKSSTFNAVKHRHTAHDIKNLQNYPSDEGYHQKE